MKYHIFLFVEYSLHKLLNAFKLFNLFARKQHMSMRPKISVVLPYYGQFPIWIEAFLRSCAFNEEMEWLIYTDITPPNYQPKNVRFIHFPKTKLVELIEAKTGIKHALKNPYKLCDFKPLYGHIFEDDIVGQEYWGHCDMDVIWGDMTRFLQKIKYTKYDIVSTRPNAISGHFTLYRNITSLNHYYKHVPNYQQAFTQDFGQGFDEGYFSFHLFNEIKNGQCAFKPYWKKRNCLDRGELKHLPHGWYWQSGKIKNTLGFSANYLHMIDWKRKLKTVNLHNIPTLDRFKIEERQISTLKPVWPFRWKSLKENTRQGLWRYLKLQSSLLQDSALTKDQPNVSKRYRVLGKN
ncbi:DUF6625 family protein [Agaribacter flavus]|uniref:DUF6625 family protein n=1 Tax=Agaribacter flavus TaxID=1902781 RepID=A0ABV7FQ95_9ALTE